MNKKAIIKAGTYYDSVTLMSVARDVKGMDGINEAVIVMGTQSNKDILENADLLLPKAKEAKANDLVIVVEGEDDKLETVFDEVETILKEKKAASSNKEENNPKSFEGALQRQPDSNLAIISVPGTFAAREARKALNNGLNVMLFSDNVDDEDEIELKALAEEKGLLMMGPDCGTAIINQAPLAFANVVGKGPVGIVAASGTGAQEVSTLIDQEGIGLSQVIGTGGRDLSTEINGIEMIKDMKALDADDDTEVIVLVSKPPAAEVSKKIISEVKKMDKQVIINFLGGDSSVVEGTDAIWAETLEDAALKAVNLAADSDHSISTLSEEEIEEIVEAETSAMNSEQKYLRGLYTGGTLCSEALLILSNKYGDMYSNIPLKDDYSLKDDLKSIENTIIDLGEDEFTQGKPHPMIEPFMRSERLIEEIEDEKVAVVLADVVLGYGSHKDPAGELAETVKKAKEKFEERGGYLSVIVSVCGTEKDPQNLEEQKKALRKVGVKILPTNAQASIVAARILNKIN